LQDLEAFHDDAPGDDGVRRGDGRDDVARHRLDVEAALLRDAENLQHAKLPNKTDYRAHAGIVQKRLTLAKLTG
jgi:hypothetical protein